MSRIGKKPIVVPAGVTVSVSKDNTVTVKGPKGELSEKINPAISVEVSNGEINVTRNDDEKESRALHGLSRTLIANMVEGVEKGFTKTLEIVGVGYRATKQGNKLVLNIGYSHPVEFEEPAGIKFEVPAPTKIVINGASKQMVGEMAANIRKVRQPEPYKGKGIKYDYEHVRRKVGKTGK